MNKCMVDLETLGNKPGCSIISIGAVMFDEDTGQLGATFYVTISRESNIRYGLVEDEATLKWWGEQSSEARTLLNEVRMGGTPLPQALAMFTEFLVTTQYTDWVYKDQMTLEKSKIMDRLTMWGNGADFDNAILAVAYDKVNGVPPWKFWNNRCYRTLKNLYPRQKLARVGVHHNALDDAKTQARHAIYLLRDAAHLPPIVTPWWGVLWLRVNSFFGS